MDDSVIRKETETIETIMSRRSIRSYLQKEIADADLEIILKAGMSGPSCVNARDWSFLVIRDKELLSQMAEANGRAAEPLKNAVLGIMVCGDLSRAFPAAQDYWIIDGAIAAQNMILAAQSMGIGSVWLGTWPQMERVQKQQKLFALPDHIIPHSIIAFGYPTEDEKGDIKGNREIENDRVHYERW